MSTTNTYYVSSVDNKLRRTNFHNYKYYIEVFAIGNHRKYAMKIKKLVDANPMKYAKVGSISIMLK